jgi:hypothetical protein
MPIDSVARAATAGHRTIVRELALACIHHFLYFRNIGVGVGNGSCCASVKLSAPRVARLGYRFGHSQAHLLDRDAIRAGRRLFNPQQHAERQAHAAGMLAGGYGEHLFVELAPCRECADWCEATIPRINVWWLYPDTHAMRVAHAGGRATQVHALDAALP